MAKIKTLYRCQDCGTAYPQWAGQCTACGTWNSIQEELSSPQTGDTSRRKGYSGATLSEVKKLSDITFSEQERIILDNGEIDRVLGGGLVPGSVVLIGGDPGIGKSTILLQAMGFLSPEYEALYVTGEESLQQVSMRANRLGLSLSSLKLLSETHVERILAIANELKPKVMVVDSIQTVYTELLQSAPGSVGQLRESTAQLVAFAKQTGISLFLVGHVTKEGSLAGPRVLEHMVDTVLYFEGESDSRFRLIRATKNRFGTVNELGVFAMTEKGLKGISNPSAIFLSGRRADVAGSVVLVTWEGSRPLLVEVQALVDESHIANPRRVTVGLEQNRLSMLLAVLHRHGGIITYDQDVFVNVVGGVKVTETAADLALLLAIVSSLKNRALPDDLIVFGEVGLSGEIRPVQNGQERLRQAAKVGVKRAVVPTANCPKKNELDMEIIAVEDLKQALSEVL